MKALDLPKQTIGFIKLENSITAIRWNRNQRNLMFIPRTDLLVISRNVNSDSEVFYTIPDKSTPCFDSDGEFNGYYTYPISEKMVYELLDPNDKMLDDYYGDAIANRKSDPWTFANVSRAEDFTKYIKRLGLSINNKIFE